MTIVVSALLPQRMMTAAERVLSATAAPHCTRPVRRSASCASGACDNPQHRLQKVGCGRCSEKKPNEELLRWIAQSSSSKTRQSPQRVMTFLKQLFSRDIFGSSHCHNEIQHAGSSCWFALSAARHAAHNRVSVITANVGAKTRCGCQSLMIF